MRYVVLRKLLCVAILGFSCMGEAVSGTSLRPETIDDGRYIASHTNQNNYTWILEITFQYLQIITTKIIGKFPKIELWQGGEWGGSKWHLLRSGE